MKYLKVFENQAEESAWKESEEYIKTSLSMDKENMDELSYNSKVEFRAEYNLEDLEGDVKLMNCGNIFDSLKVNGIEAVTGTVEATREEVKCGVGGEKIYWELHIPSGVYDTDNMDWDANENLMMPKYAILNSDFEIELVGSYTEEDIMNGSVQLYEIDDGWTTLESKGFIFKNEGKTRFGISAMYTSEINSFYYGGALRVVPFFQLSGATGMYEEIIVRGSYLRGEDVVENITVTSSDLGLDDNSNLCVTNTDKYIGGKVKELYLSHDSTNTNLGILLSLILPMSEPQCNGVLNLEEAVTYGVVTQIDNNKYSVSSYYIGQFCCIYSSALAFVNLDYVTDGLLTSADGLIPTTCEILKEDFDIYEYNREELKFTSATDMLSAQIVTNVNFNDIYSAYGLFSNIDSETNIIASYCYAIEIGGVRESLVTIGDGVYQFPQSWIDAAQEIFNSGGSVTFISTNLGYVIMMFDNIKSSLEDDRIRTVALDMYEMSYSIIQESMSGGAPKELSVDASVGRVSLIGEVNDYFSTLPSNGFEGCPLETVIIPDNVKSIGTKCFGHCDRLKKVYLPQNMDKLADYSFGGNSVKRGNVVNVRSVKDESPLAFGDYGGKGELYEWVDLGLPSGLK